MLITLKVNAEGRTSEKTSIPADTTLQTIVKTLSEKIGIATSSLQIFTGYPLVQLKGAPSDRISDLGVKNSDVITVRSGSPPSLSANDVIPPLPPPAAPAAAAAALPVANSDTLISTVHSTSLSSDEWSCQICTFINRISSRSGESRCEMCSTVRLVASMRRRIIDADNSCLFNSVGFLVCRSKNIAEELRDIVRTAVQNDPENFSSAMLGKEREEYLHWIMQPTSWGGETEIMILTGYFKVEIAVVDIRTTNIYVYGKDANANQRIYLLYDGIHYDALARSTQDEPSDSDQTMFSLDDSKSFEESKAIAGELKQRSQFVDLAGFDLKCMVCGIGIKGQTGAQAHAKSTGHTNFGQVHA
jgi:ubiquitin thioesterase OTU1